MGNKLSDFWDYVHQNLWTDPTPHWQLVQEYWNAYGNREVWDMDEVEKAHQLLLDGAKHIVDVDIETPNHKGAVNKFEHFFRRSCLSWDSIVHSAS